MQLPHEPACPKAQGKVSDLPTMSKGETLDVIVHGSYCEQWEEPSDVMGWLALQLSWRNVDGGREGFCPVCGEVVYVMSDEGSMELGT